MIKLLYVFAVMVSAAGALALDALKPAGEGVPVEHLEGYAIVIPHDADIQDRASAALMKEYLDKIFDCQFPIRMDSEPVEGNFISIGATGQFAASGLAANPASQGYAIGVEDGNIYISGGLRGAAYGVTAFLEEDLGCRYYAVGCVKIPRIAPGGTVAVHPRSYTPFFEVREPLYAEAMNNEWAAFNKIQPLSFHFDVPYRAGGGLGNPEYFIHTYDKLVSAKEYFSTHPEYFAMRNGERFPATQTAGQLCYTNEDIPAIMAGKLEEAIRQNPDTRIYSVTSNDNILENCECLPCQELITREGISGAQLQLVNKVADIIAGTYPDIRITSLAYYGSLNPPPGIKPSPNVVIFFAPILQRFNPTSMILPLEDNKILVDALLAWRQITDNIYIWDYVDYIITAPTPFPNFEVRKRDLDFLQRVGVKGVFLQGAYNGHASLGALKAWVFAKELWDKDYPQDALIEEFVAAYYGDAAEYMQQYVDLQRDAWTTFYRERSGNSGLQFSAAELERMGELLELAEQKVAASPEYRKRIDYELLTYLSLRLEPSITAENEAGYAESLAKAETLLRDLDIPLMGEMLTAPECVRRWHKKLDNFRKFGNLPTYSPDSVIVKEPICYVSAKFLPDEAATMKLATRQDSPNEWSVQYEYKDFLDRLDMNREYVIVARARGEFKKPGEAPRSNLFRMTPYTGGKECPSATVFYDRNAAQYQVYPVARLVVKSVAPAGYFFCELGDAGLLDAVWFDYIEFIPVDEYKGSEKLRDLPLFEI